MTTFDRNELRTWLRAVLQHMGWAGSDLAKAIGAHPSTINRFLNDPDATHSLKSATLKAIEKVTGIAPLVIPGQNRKNLPIPEAIEFGREQTKDAGLDNTIFDMIRSKQSLEAWIMQSRALEAAGFNIGDIFIVDIAEQPMVQDVVCAQINNWNFGRAETVFRIYHPPYLIASTSVSELMKPFLLEDDRVVIVGVVIKSLRRRRAGSVAA